VRLPNSIDDGSTLTTVSVEADEFEKNGTFIVAAKSMIGRITLDSLLPGNRKHMTLLCCLL
jgi:hypothetical protein